MRTLRNEGVADSAIARAFGVTRQYVNMTLGKKEDHSVFQDVIDTTHFAERLSTWRTKHRFTQVQLAEMWGVNSITLSRWENGHASTPYIPLILRYMDLYDLMKNSLDTY